MPTPKAPDKLDKRLDHAVEETFPASDPIAVSTPEQKTPDGKPMTPKRTGAPPFPDAPSETPRAGKPAPPARRGS